MSFQGGVFVGAGFEVDLIINYQSGQISLALSGNFNEGFLNGGGVTVTTGFTYNLGPDNQNFANMNTVGSLQVTLPGTSLAVALQAAFNSPGFNSLAIDPSQGVMVAAGISISVSAFAGVPFSVSVGGSATPTVVNIANITSLANTALSPIDRLMYEAARRCR